MPGSLFTRPPRPVALYQRLRVVGIIGRCGVAMRPRASKLWSSPLGQILDEFTDETHIDTRFTDSKICQAVYLLAETPSRPFQNGVSQQ